MFTALDDPFPVWLSLTALAELERTQEQFDAAIAVHERSLALLQKTADPKSRFSLATMKILGPVFGMQAEMLGPLEKFPDILKPMLLGLMEVLTRDAYGKTLIDAGALERAEEQLEKAEAASSMFAGLIASPIAPHFGDLRRAQWRLDEARDSYVKALQGGEVMRAMSFGDPRAELAVLGKLAELEVFTGRVDEALAWSDRALKLVRELKDPKREADVLQARANLLQKAGRFDSAIPLYDEALKVAVTNSDLFRQASIHSDLGTLHMFQGTYGTSAKHLGRRIFARQRSSPGEEKWFQRGRGDRHLVDEREEDDGRSGLSQRDGRGDQGNAGTVGVQGSGSG